ncbi:glycosyltransferase, partial [Patescibacteria group bacterium]|nr:glycosyltransferase [Patescibacteria group bacterium]
FMWRNHYGGSFLTDIAAAFCNKVFCTSKFSYTAKYKKTVLMPVGVDVDSCKMDVSIDRIPRSVLFLGRLDESKRPHLLIEAFGIIAKQGIKFNATFVGGPSKTDSGYPIRLEKQVEELGIRDKVKFVGAVPNTETFRYYRSHDVFVNCSKSGMFDKTIFKSVACGCLTIATSRDFGDLVGDEFIFADNDSKALAEKLKRFLTVSFQERAQFMETLASCIKNHSLEALVIKLKEEIDI